MSGQSCVIFACLLSVHLLQPKYLEANTAHFHLLMTVFMYFLLKMCFYSNLFVTVVLWVTDADDGTERVCDTLLMCIITVLNQGLRNGGGVGDILRRPSKEVG